MDAILKKYGAKALPLEEKAKLGVLPDTLTIAQIAYLWAYDTQHCKRDGPRERLLKEALKEAVRAKALRGSGKPEHHTTTTLFDATPPWLRGYGEPIRRRATAIHDGSGVKISRGDFSTWLTREGEGLLPTHCFLAGWWGKLEAGDFNSDAALGRECRARLKVFAQRGADTQKEGRGVEWARWRDAAQAIQANRKQRPASKLELARLVKERLNLPDEVETIRKRL